MSDFKWGTVTSVSPLRIRLDGDAAQLPITPDSLIDPLTLTIADRVRVEIANNRVIIHGRSGGEYAAVRAAVNVAVPVGTIVWTVAVSAGLLWLVPNGSDVSRSTYPDLFTACNPVVGNPTMATGSPGLLTLTNHGLFTGDQVYLTTTGALLTGLTANANLWAIRVSSTTFRLATSLANARAGTAINLSGTQSGTHTIRRTFGVGNGSTTFTLPNIAGRTIFGVDPGQAEFDGLGETGGNKNLMQHRHTIAATSNALVHTTGGGGAGSGSGIPPHNSSPSGTPNDWGGAQVETAGTGGTDNALPPYITLTPMIRALAA